MSQFSSDRPFVIGTRGSDLALTQARMTKAALLESGILAEEAIEVRVIKTIGDKRPDLKLSEFSQVGADGRPALVDKGIFTRELEQALNRREIDIAVHSLKDVPTELADQFFIAATLPRAAIEDVLLTRESLGDDPGQAIAAIAADAVVATSSVRRARQLRWLRPDLQVEDIRGNVATRVRKLLDSKKWAATMLARAGLERLGLLESAASQFGFEGRTVYATVLPATQFLPAAGQGAIGIETLVDHADARAVVAVINDQATFQRVSAERAFLARLKAGCQTPIGAHTWFEEDGRLTMQVRVFDEEREAAEPAQGSASDAADQPEALVDSLMKIL